MNHKLTFLAAPLLVSALTLTGCGGSSSSSSNSSTPPPTATSQFVQSQDWTVTLNQKDSQGDLDHTRFCFDFVNGVQGEDAQCDTGNQWGLIADNGQSPTLWTNGGVTNPQANGAGFGFFSWDELKTWNSATSNPTGTDISILYNKDSASGIFSAAIDQNSWFAYNLAGMHRIYPNFNVYLITTDSSLGYAPDTTATFALQITGYYGGPTGTQSGQLSLRWIDVSQPSNVLTATIDASSSDNWAYFDLQNGTVVDSPSNNNWHIAFKRTDVILNGGDAGTGNIGGFIGKHLDGFYDTQGNPIKSAFDNATLASTLTALQQVDGLTTPTRAADWVVDTNSSIINPSPECIMGARGPDFCQYGLYSYNPAGIVGDNGSFVTPTHGLAPRGANSSFDTNPEGAVLLRSGDGESYARLYVTGIQYSTTKDANGNDVLDASGNPELDRNGSQTWTFHFDVQPAN